MYSNSFIPLITRPTRVTSTSATLIDNIYTNNLQNIQNTLSGISTTDMTDHFTIFHICWTCRDKENEKYFFKRCLSSANKRKFKEMISNENWLEVLNNEEAQSAFTIFHTKIKSIYDSIKKKK